MKLVIVESPFRGNENYHQHEHERYARLALRDCLERNEAPLASHALYTLPGVLDDNVPKERLLGMNAGWAWMPKADLVVAYIDLGISNGMALGIARAKELGIPTEERKLPAKLKSEFARSMEHHSPSANG